jgi:predicted transposase YbfD/YdcC
MAGSIVSLFARMPDPRGDRGVRHLLSDVMVIAVLAVLCGAEDFVGMEQFGRAKHRWLRTFLSLPHGIPSHDTFGRVFAALDPECFEACFAAWTRAVAGEIHGVVAIDGKTLRRSFDAASGKAAVHMISAWAGDNGVVFGQLAVDEKSNEITAIPRLLGMLGVKGLIVTIDAIGCQKQIARQIADRGGEYVLTVKENQPVLLEDVRETFRWARAQRFHGLRHAHSEQTEKGHGRIETRRVSVLWELSLLRDAAAWADLRCIAEVRSTRRIGEKTQTQTRYFISNLDTRDARELGRACRAHWGVENGLHWCLDVGFREDASRVRVGCAAENLSRLRRICLNLLKLETSKKCGIRSKRLIAAWDHNYLLRLLRA